MNHPENTLNIRHLMQHNCILEVPDTMQYDMPVIIDEVGLSQAIKIQLHKLTFAMTQPDRQYKVFHIPKKASKLREITLEDGTKRTVKEKTFRKICAPTLLMKAIQSRIRHFILDKVPLPRYITGFRKGVSCLETARIHEHGETIISLDIKDFFPSVRAKTVRYYFNSWGYSWPVANMIAGLLTTKNKIEIPKKNKEGIVSFHEVDTRGLPQGSPASPTMSNIVAAMTFGPELEAFCNERNLNLTLYVDDVTVSTKQGVKALNSDESWDVIRNLTKIINKHGFVVKFEKTKIMSKGKSKQTVMGVTVNDGMHVAKRYFYFKAILHNTLQNGWLKEACKWTNLEIKKAKSLSTNDKDFERKLKFFGFVGADNKPITEASLSDEKTIMLGKYIAWLRGNINWITQVDPRKGEMLASNLKLAYAAYKSSKAKDTTEITKPMPSYTASADALDVGLSERLGGLEEETLSDEQTQVLLHEMALVEF